MKASGRDGTRVVNGAHLVDSTERPSAFQDEQGTNVVPECLLEVEKHATALALAFSDGFTDLPDVGSAADDSALEIVSL